MGIQEGIYTSSRTGSLGSIYIDSIVGRVEVSPQAIFRQGGRYLYRYY
jgi:hypothetical protein